MNAGLKRELETIESKKLFEIEDESVTRCCFDDGDCRKRPQWVEWRPKPLPRSKQTELAEVLRSASSSPSNSEDDRSKQQFDISKLDGALAAQNVGAKAAVHLIKTSGSNALINGEGNLFKMSFRTCKLQIGGTC